MTLVLSCPLFLIPRSHKQAINMDNLVFQIASAWKPVMKQIGLWKSVRSIARLYDAGMGMIIFIPIAISSWFPFVSTFQTRLMFNQAFSRGLEISLILAGNNPNTGL